MSEQQSGLMVPCPTCRKETEFSSKNPFRPFCSERCQTLDLGAWADERYKVPVSESQNVSVNEKSGEDEALLEHLPPKHHLN